MMHMKLYEQWNNWIALFVGIIGVVGQTFGHPQKCKIHEMICLAVRIRIERNFFFWHQIVESNLT